MRKNTTAGLSSAATAGFFSALLERVAKEGAVRVDLKPGGKVTPTALHAWAVGNGMAFVNGILAVDQRAKRPIAG